tara:strand:- start:241 stop:507 length:267 start_codon:yes stop_codon:yes gene_type:complete
MHIESFLNLLPSASLAASSLMLTVWIISLFINDVSIVDIAWGLGFVILGWVGWCQLEAPGLRQNLVLILVSDIETTSTFFPMPPKRPA